MPRQIPIDGGKFAIFPDDTPEEEMRSALESHTQQQSVWGALPPIAKALTQAFTPDNTMIPVPSMPKGTFGLSTEAVQGMVGQRQNAQQFNAQQAMQQRVQRERALESEQERAQQFKLEQMRFKNESGLRQLEAEKRLEAAKWSAELDANQPINIPGVGLYDPKTKQIMQGTQAQKPMDRFTASDGQVYNVSADGTYIPVPGIRGYVPRQGGYGGGGGAEVSLQRVTLADGSLAAWNPKTNTAEPILGPDGKPLMAETAQAQQPRPTPAQQAKERFLQNRYSTLESRLVNSVDEKEKAALIAEMGQIESEVYALYPDGNTSSAPANVIGNTEIEIVDDPFVGPPTP